MLRSLLLCLLVVALAGCAVGAPATPTPKPGSVTIRNPQTGSILYSPTLYFSGQASDLPANQFRLTVVTAADETLIDTPITVTDGAWTYEAPNSYTGDPAELTISALDASGGILDIASVMLSTEAQRPDGVFGTILTPFDGDTVGGEMIPVGGTASGLFEGTLNVDLETLDGNVISGLVLTVENPGMMDEVPWQTDLPTNEYRGPAVVHAYYHSARDGEVVTIARVSVNVADAAG